jgi:hypothetical protein
MIVSPVEFLSLSESFCAPWKLMTTHDPLCKGEHHPSSEPASLTQPRRAASFTAPCTPLIALTSPPDPDPGR